jgi:signal transduction histidine kinase
MPDNAGLAHDAGNLLQALGLYCDLLLQPGVLRPEHIHYATELRLISSRSSELIRRLLTSSMVPSAEGTLNQDAAPSLTSSLRALAPVLQRIAGPTIQVAVETGPSLPLLNFPVGALERITLNLVLNAAQALQGSGRVDGRIQVMLGVHADRLQLLIEDNGPGIPPGLAAAFLRPTPLLPGTLRGIGHRVVHELAAATGGQISIRVRPGHGSAFCLKWAVPDAPLLPPPTLSATEAPAA